MVYFFNIGCKKRINFRKNLPIGWKVSEKLIPPQCFSTEWMSSDNYEEFAKSLELKIIKIFKKLRKIFR